MADPSIPTGSSNGPKKSRFETHDMASTTAGKYQHCTRWNGLLYADSDFGPDGQPKPGALPAPVQGSLEADIQAASMIHAHAARITAEALARARQRQTPSAQRGRGWLDRLRRLFR